MRKVVHVVGARPNYMKATPVILGLERHTHIEQILVHTGQHYDENMSKIFFDQLGMPEPDFNLEVGSSSHAVQTAEVMIRFEAVVEDLQPDLVLVYGDVNSTLAAAVVAAKLGIRVGHVEAGLRSWDRSMPEEINRVLTDQISDILFTPSDDGDRNLNREGISSKKVHMVGNVMIDTLVRLLEKARQPEIPELQERFALVTLHRPSNVDDLSVFRSIINMLNEISGSLQIIFPIHPRTRKMITEGNISVQQNKGFIIRDPLGYLEFLWLQEHATVVLTDSGGIQEETTFLQVPCLTLRDSTERPITESLGTNIVVGNDMALAKEEVLRILNGNGKVGSIPPLWDGKTGERIAGILAEES